MQILINNHVNFVQLVKYNRKPLFQSFCWVWRKFYWFVFQVVVNKFCRFGASLILPVQYLHYAHLGNQLGKSTWLWWTTHHSMWFFQGRGEQNRAHVPYVACHGYEMARKLHLNKRGFLFLFGVNRNNSCLCRNNSNQYAANWCQQLVTQ